MTSLFIQLYFLLLVSTIITTAPCFTCTLAIPRAKSTSVSLHEIKIAHIIMFHNLYTSSHNVIYLQRWSSQPQSLQLSLGQSLSQSHDSHHRLLLLFNSKKINSLTIVISLLIYVNINC